MLGERSEKKKEKGGKIEQWEIKEKKERGPRIEHREEIRGKRT